MTTAEEQAKKLAREVRDYVRDYFRPGSIDSLNGLEQMVMSKVWTTLVVDRAAREINEGKNNDATA